MDLAIRAAVRDSLPIRVIVCDGQIRDADESLAEASRVQKRLLDPVPWAVTAHDADTGHCTVTRGAPARVFVDQFSVLQEAAKEPQRRTVSGQAFVRDPEVRRTVLQRAGGMCEWCKQPGFTMADGRIYLETHHIIPLAEKGADTERNVVALCPNHHGEAHHGANSAQMREMLLEPDPGDVDIFMLMEDLFDSSLVRGEAVIIFDHQAAQNVPGASVFWIRRLAAIGGESEALQHWQTKRDNTRRGIVEVISDDSQRSRT